MQAIIIALGNAGIQFFGRHILAQHIINLLKTMRPPDRTIKVQGGFVLSNITSDQSYFVGSDISITMNNGSIQGLDPKLTEIVQDNVDKSLFTIRFQAGSFSAAYDWTENYRRDLEDYVCTGFAENEVCRWILRKSDQISDRFSYNPRFSGLDIHIKIQFKYDAQTGWQMIVHDKPVISTTESDPNIPGGSAVQKSGQKCQFGSSVADAALDALSHIDFSVKLAEVVQGVLATIPKSGDLGEGILFDFSMGDSGLSFPTANSVQMGVKGGASYQGAAYSGDTPPLLPLPAAPGDKDPQHLRLYVSSYELEALHWAFFKAGKLNTVVNPTDLDDPGALKVATYVAMEKSLQPFKSFAMQALITQNEAPVTLSQLVWEFTQPVMDTLKNLLPPNVFHLLGGLQGNAYVALQTLEDDLRGATVPESNFAAIENAAKRMGMAVTQNMNFVLLIENGAPTPPDIRFSLRRTDVLTDLKLGIGGDQRQTLQYSFLSSGYEAAFISSTVPSFKGATFGAILWPVAGEPHYDKVLAGMGATGAPIPIMQGFQFDFDNAQLSLQQGYVSILANVRFL